MEPLVELTVHWIRSALKNRYRIGERGNPWGSPACGSFWLLEVCPFTIIVAVRSEQKASIQRTKSEGALLAVNRCSNLSLCTPLYAPFTSKLMRLSTLFDRQAL